MRFHSCLFSWICDFLTNLKNLRLLYRGNKKYPWKHRKENDLIYANIRNDWLQIYVSNSHSSIEMNSSVFDTQSDSTSLILLWRLFFSQSGPLPPSLLKIGKLWKQILQNCFVGLRPMKNLSLMYCNIVRRNKQADQILSLLFAIFRVPPSDQASYEKWTTHQMISLKDTPFESFSKI